MNVLILGSGGRECALAWKISQSYLCKKLFVAPGNGGTKIYGENIEINPNDFLQIKNFCISNNINLVVVGPEDPLVNGIIDFFASDKDMSEIKIIGPDKKSAMLEGSKAFAKQFMNKYNIPTAKYCKFDYNNINKAKDFINSLNAPYVIKADGLAGGKGVIICDQTEEAYKIIDDILVDKVFGEAGNSIIIEEFLKGIELSAFVLTDGNSFVLLPEAKDYKRIGENDTGLNTGGMGTLSPVPFANKSFMGKVVDKVIKPTINGIKQEKMNYKGFIFFGLMNVNGEPYVIEYNVRLGDPETQSILPRIENDLLELLVSTADAKIENSNIIISKQHIVNVVLASSGYPEKYEKNKEITLPILNNNELIFPAGTTIENKTLKSSGGRVLSACGIGNNIDEAIKNAYNLAEKIKFENKYYRNDIGNDIKEYIKNL